MRYISEKEYNSRMKQLADDINKGLGATIPTTSAKPTNPMPFKPSGFTTVNYAEFYNKVIVGTYNESEMWC